jgi:hypothetical protein
VKLAQVQAVTLDMFLAGEPIPIYKSQLDYAKLLADALACARWRQNDGVVSATQYENRLYGQLGDVVVRDLLGLPRPVIDGEKKGDGGIDAEYLDLTLQIKTTLLSYAEYYALEEYGHPADVGLFIRVLPCRTGVKLVGAASKKMIEAKAEKTPKLKGQLGVHIQNFTNFVEACRAAYYDKNCLGI